MIWVQALRIFSFTATAVPILLCMAVAYHERLSFSWLAVLLVLIGVISLHAGTNLVNDYYDYQRGLDTKETLGSSRVLVDGLLSPQEMKNGIIFFYLTAVLCGCYFLLKYGLPLAIILLIGLVGSFLYTGGGRFSFKYLALGEISTFILIGPLLFTGIFLALTGIYSPGALGVSLPIGFLSAAIVSSNNIRDIQEDRDSGIKTIGTLFGHRIASGIYTAEILIAYFFCPILIYLRVFNISSLLMVLSLPMAWGLIQLVRHNKSLSPLIAAQTAQLQLIFGLILAVSFMLPI
jgi:1,4-dihydroxy-2-naphthoate octaprenyltransferase